MSRFNGHSIGDALCQAELAKLTEHLQVVAAERDASLDALSSLVGHVSAVGGYMSHAMQTSLREAQETLVRAGR